MAKTEILNQQQLDRLAEVIGEVEQKTSGEVRLMIVKRSAVSGHVQMVLWGLLVSLTFLVLWFGRHDLIFWERWWMWPAILVFHYFLAAVLSRLEPVQRRFTPMHDMRHQVLTRAEVEFHREGLSGTRAHTGILLFVSLFEHQAVVLADKGIADRVPPGAWDQVLKTILEGARSGKWAEKLEQALRECGAYLASHFPPSADNGNELPNTVIMKD